MLEKPRSQIFAKRLQPSNKGAADQNGAATLGGGVVEVRALPGAYGYRTAYPILTATNGVAGSFGSVS